MRNTTLINALYQNTDMGLNAIRKIYPKIQNSSLRNEVKNQFLCYKQQKHKYVDLMKAGKISVEKVPLMIKAMTSTGIAFNCAKDDSSEHIAEMLIQGTNMGIIEGRRLMNHKHADKEVERLVSDYVKNQEKAVEELKNFL